MPASKSVKLNATKSLPRVHHDTLVDTLMGLYTAHNRRREQVLDIFAKIDRSIHSYIELDDADSRRQQDNDAGRGVKPTDSRQPLIWTQLEEATTFAMLIFAPESRLYTAMAHASKQEAASAFAAHLNEHAETFGHYNALARFVFDSLRYNWGGLTTYWRRQRGQTMQFNDATLGAQQSQNGVVFEGNYLENLDPYNTVYDITCPTREIASEGEFFCTIDIKNDWWLRKRIAQGHAFIDAADVALLPKKQPGGSEDSYYRARPSVRSVSEQDAQTDWDSIMTQGSGSNQSVDAFERLRFRKWLVPKDYKLSDRTELELWDIEIIGGKEIIRAEPIENNHGLLPITIACPVEDGFGDQTKRFPERLQPLEDFASFLLNSHVRSQRKQLNGGLTAYSNKHFPAGLQNIEGEGGHIGFDSQPNEQTDVSRIIKQFVDAPDTGRNLENFAAAQEIMQQILPTEMLQQVAQLQRATQYQAASTVQAANRRLLRYVKNIDQEAFVPVRRMMMFNTYQFAQTIEVVDQEGQLQPVEPSQFQNSKVEFTIGDGLKGLDRLALVLNIKEVLNAILQSSVAANKIDVVKIIDYWTSLLGDHTDFKQFALQSPIDSLPVEERNAAFQLLQQAIQSQQGEGNGPPEAGGVPG